MSGAGSSRLRRALARAPRLAAWRAAGGAAAVACLALGSGSHAGPRPIETCDGGCPIDDVDDHLQPNAGARGARFVTLPDVVLSHRVAQKLAPIAEHYHRRTGKTLVVTSGTRDPQSQAEAVFDKLQAGDDIVRLYRHKQAAQELRAAYDRHRGRGRQAAITAMAHTIKSQIGRGIFISSHLRAGAADIRSTDMTALDRRHFVEGALSTKGVSVLYESIPPHFHIQLE